MLYYRVDITEVVLGRGPAPALVLALVEGLPDDSWYYAALQGGDEFLGWGRDRYMVADLFDALMFVARSSGNLGKRKLPEYPRPKKMRPKKGKRSVADLYQLFTRKRG